MQTTEAKIQKTSDKVYEELKKEGFSKLFNWVDFNYFKKQVQKEGTNQNIVFDIVELFKFYNSETSDFADYEF